MKFTFFSFFFCIHTDSYISGKLTNEMNSVFFKLVKKIPRKLVVLLYCQICIGMFLKLIELLGIWCEKEQNSTETKISLSQYEIQPDTVHMPGVYTFTIYRIQFFFSIHRCKAREQTAFRTKPLPKISDKCKQIRILQQMRLN